MVDSSKRKEKECALIMSPLVWMGIETQRRQGSRTVRAERYIGIAYAWICVYPLVTTRSRRGRKRDKEILKLFKCECELQENWWGLYLMDLSAVMLVSH